MTVWLTGGILTAITIAILLAVLWRRRDHISAAAHEIAVYEDQLVELDRDEERGLIPPDDAGAVRQEIERRLQRAREEGDDAPAHMNANLRLATAAAVIILFPAAGFGIYSSLGTPQFADQPFAERAKPPATDDPRVAEMTRVVEQLAERMKIAPNRLDGWVLLGRSYMTLERHLEAAQAYTRARSLAPDRADIAIALGEAMVIVQNGIVSDEAVRLFQSAASGDPETVKAHYFLGLGAAQRRAFGEAVQRWTDMIAMSQEGAPWLPEVKQRREAAAIAGGIDLAKVRPTSPPDASVPRGPSEEDVRAAAGMSAEDRAALIRSMVDGLAQRLEDAPDDLEGWKRLARAYRVLGENEKAAEAEARIRQLEAR